MAAISAFLLTEAAFSCNVPVFRYALERWSPDHVDFIVFHDADLTASQEQIVTTLEAASSEGPGTANVRVIRQAVNAPMEEATSQLWDTIRQKEVAMPYVAVRTKLASRIITNWQGPLSAAGSSGLMSSPARTEICRRILAGDSAVWVVVKPKGDKPHKVVSSLRTQLAQLSEDTPLPEGVGLPGSELFADVPLLTKFSLLEVDSEDPREEFLVELLKKFEPEALQDGEPLIVPVFGRARALEVIPASQLDSSLVEDLTMFLCGACSCQVKAQNPGFDLLTGTAWDKKLFGDTGTALPPLQIPTKNTDGKPTTVAIPSGKAASKADAPNPSADVSTADSTMETDTVSADQQAADDVGRSGSVLSLFVVLLVIVVVALSVAHSVDF